MSERAHEWLHLALEAAQMGTWSWDLDTDEVVWAGRVAPIFGRPESELGNTYAAFLHLVHPDDRADVEQRMRAALHEQPSPYAIEHRVVWPDGTVRWVELRGQAYRAPDGRPIRVAGAVVDITDRKRTRRALAHGKERLQHYNRVLTELAKGVRSAWGELDQSLHLITEAVANALNVERTNVWLFDEQHTRITCIDHYQRSTDRHTRGAVLRAADYPSYFDALTDARIIDAHDALRDPRTREFAADYFAEHRIRSLLDAPIRVGGELVGVVCFEQVGAPRTWTPEEQVFAGSMADFVALALEAAQRREAEQALRASKEYAEGLIASMPDGFSVFDTELRQVQVNEALCRMTGFSPEELIGAEPPYPYWPPEELETIQAEFEKMIAGEPVENIELVFMRKNGERFPVIVAPSMLTDEAGEVINYFSTMKDITERKRAEEALQESETRFRTLVENTPVAFFAVDRDGVFTMSEGRQLIRLGLEPGELVGQSIFDAYADYPNLVENVRRVLDGEERTWRTQIGDYTFDSYAAPLRNEHGEVVNAIGVATDVTERTRVARENARLVKDLRTMSIRLLETQEQERRRIARELHDEAGALLTSLQMCLDTAHRHVPAGERAAAVAREELQEAQALASTLSTQIRGLALNLHPSVLDDLGLAAALQWLADWHARHTGLTVRLYHEIGEQQRFAQAVETAAYRIIQEALTNASRYAEVEEVQVMVNVLEDHLRIHVIDEGAGFDLKSVQREHETVGLSSMRERAELLQGNLEIATAPGEGTRISATLPIQAPESEP